MKFASRPHLKSGIAKDDRPTSLICRTIGELAVSGPLLLLGVRGLESSEYFLVKVFKVGALGFDCPPKYSFLIVYGQSIHSIRVGGNFQRRELMVSIDEYDLLIQLYGLR
jgi:hypothetical protein